MYCASLSLVKGDDEKVEGTILPCNLWPCEHCRPLKQRELKRLAMAGIPDTFITLTASADTAETPDEAARALVRAWRLIVKRAKRHFNIKSLPYIAVMEATKKGQPHVHILCRVRWLPQRWLSAQTADIANAPIVWIERISGGHKAAGYISKYLGKDPHRFGGCKRYWRSLDWIADRKAWDDAKNKNKGDWTVCRFSLSRLADELVSRGYAVSWPRTDWIVGEAAGVP